MPELPEVETVCRLLSPRIVGRRFAHAEVYWERTVEPLDQGVFASQLSGLGVERIFRRAKLIVLALSDCRCLTIHLRMTGKLFYVDSDACPVLAEPLTHLRARLRFDEAGELQFYDARKFGRIRLLDRAEWVAIDASLGAEPLDAAFTVTALRNALAVRNRQIKPLLLDQSVIAGIGNIYADEALFKARIHPLQRASTISNRKVASLHSAIIDTLQGAIERQGTTIRDYRSAPGEEGTNQSSLLVYGSPAGARCPRCDSRLKRLVVGQRGTTICPRCQRLS